MKLILIDKQDIATIAREEVLRDQYHYKVDYAFTFEDFQSKFAVGKYRIVILDFAIEPGAEALEFVNSQDPTQRMIVISASNEYSEPHGCAYCVEHFNRRRLMKPFSVMELANLIRDFEETSCAYYRE